MVRRQGRQIYSHVASRALHGRMHQQQSSEAERAQKLLGSASAKVERNDRLTRLRIGSARNQMYAVYSRNDLGPDYLRRLYGEMDVTISRSLPQIADWVAGGKFAIAIGGVDCDDMVAKGLPVVPIHLEGIAAVGAGTDPAAFLASSPHSNAAKIFLNWILSREGQIQFQKLTRENSLRVDIPKEGIVNPYYILDSKREYLFTGLEEHKDKINEFRPWLESLVMKK